MMEHALLYILTQTVITYDTTWAIVSYRVLPTVDL